MWIEGKLSIYSHLWRNIAKKVKWRNIANVNLVSGGFIYVLVYNKLVIDKASRYQF